MEESEFEVKESDKKSFWTKEYIMEEVKAIGKLFGPLFVGVLSNMGMGVVDTIFVAQLGVNELAAATLADNLWYILLYLASGYNLALDSLISQASGAGNWKLVGTIFQTSIFCLTIICIPVAILSSFGEQFLLWLQQPADISNMAGDFMLWLIPGIWFQAWAGCVQRFLQNQGHTFPSLVAGITAFLFNILANYLLIFTFGLGFKGAPIATSLSRLVTLVTIVGYGFGWKKYHEKSWFGLQLDAISRKRVTIFLKFGTFAMLTIWTEVLAFSSLSFVVGGLGSAVALDIHMIGFNVLLLSWIFPSSLGMASGSRVGNILGEGNGPRARFVAQLAYVAICICMAVNAVIILSLHTEIPKIWNATEEVAKGTSSILLIVAIALIFDGLQGMGTSLLRGVGKPNIGAVGNLVGYGLIAFPLAFLLGYPLHLGVTGVWIALAVALVLVAACMIFFLSRVDWDKEAELARERSEISTYSSTLEEKGDNVFELEPQDSDSWRKDDDLEN